MRALLAIPPLLLAATAAKAELRLFDQRSYQGRQLAVEREASNMSFSPRSAKIVNGAWEVCPRPFFGGSCIRLEQDQPNLNLPRAFSGMIRSARPAPAATRGARPPAGEPAADKPPAAKPPAAKPKSDD
jgi:hypothetical protein